MVLFLLGVIKQVKAIEFHKVKLHAISFQIVLFFLQMASVFLEQCVLAASICTLDVCNSTLNINLKLLTLKLALFKVNFPFLSS